MGSFAQQLRGDPAGANGRAARSKAPPRDPGPQLAFYLLDNSLLRSKSEGVRLRKTPSILDNDASTPMVMWGTLVRGVEHQVQEGARASREALEAADLSIRDVYGRQIPIREEPLEWVSVKAVRGSKGRLIPVSREWFLPCDITGVPMLYRQDGMLSEDDVDDEEEPAKRLLPPDSTDGLLLQPGTGALYEVVFERAVLRSCPSVSATPLGDLRKGAVVEMFDWDETRKWRQALDKRQRAGWMLLDHPEHGPLLRPQGIPFQVRPLEPICAAAMEGNIPWLKIFAEQGVDANVKDAGNRTPLMFAAERGRHEAIVVLCVIAAANMSAVDQNGNTAADLANSEATRALIQAFGVSPSFDENLCQEAIDGMEPEVREMAESVLARAIAKAKFLHSRKDTARKPEKAPVSKQLQQKGGAAEEDPWAERRQSVAALAARGKCAFCQASDFRQALVAQCCIAVYCSDCIFGRLAGGTEGSECPGCGQEVPLDRLDFVDMEEAKEEIAERLRKQRAEQREQQGAARRAVQEETAPGSGANYKVLTRNAPVRSEPRKESKVISELKQGDIVEVLHLDDTCTWGRVDISSRDLQGSGHSKGWVRMRHEDVGDLLMPV